MIKSALPRGKRIPLGIGRRKRSSRIGLNINIGGFGFGSLSDNIKPKQPVGDFKPIGRHPEKDIAEEKISLEGLKDWIVQELAHLFELKDGNKKIDVDTKKRWLLSFLPDSMIREIIDKAKKLSKED